MLISEKPVIADVLTCTERYYDWSGPDKLSYRRETARQLGVSMNTDFITGTGGTDNKA